MTIAFDSTRVADLDRHVSGPVLSPGDAAYDATRAVHNGLIDRKPAVIVRCRTTNDVVAARLSHAAQGSRSRSAAAATTWPVAP